MTMKPAEALILVVDDQPQHLETLAAILTAEGYAPVLCPSLDHVWQRATLQQPDLILVDLEFGGGTGLDFCQALWNHPVLKTTPIVVLGTIAQRPTWLHALALGAADYVIHPCDPQELCRKVKTQVELQHLRALQQADLLAQQELQQTLAAVEEATQNRRKFLATISHDIRTPLHGTLGMLKLLANTPLDSQQQMQLNLAQTSAESLLTLINDLLDFSSAEAGHLNLEIVPFNLFTCLEDCIRPFALIAEDKGLNLILDLTGIATPHVQGDPKHLRQVLTQLLSNALKFTEVGEILLQINLYDLGGTLRLEGRVKDTGIGIPADRLSSLFGTALLPPTSTSLPPSPELLGPPLAPSSCLDLGLSLVKRLCVIMGGDVAVESAVGQGSCFTFTLNLEPPYPKPQPFQPVGLGGTKVLLVIPNLTQRLILQQQLKAWGAVTVGVGTGEQALRARPGGDAVPDRPRFDVILLDATLPDMSAWEVVQRLQAEADLAQIPCILLKTIHQSPEEASHTLPPIKGMLNKPWMPPELAATLAQALVREDLFRPAISLPSPALTVLPEAIVQAQLDTWLAQQRVLLVEDHPVNQIVAEGLLQEVGFRDLDIVDQGQAALVALRQSIDRPYTLILMDCQMPGMDGYETTQRIREGEAGHQYIDVLIIAMTAHALQGDRDKCLQVGMDDYIAKPMDIQDLRQILQRWLQPSTASLEGISALDNDGPGAEVMVFDADLLLRRLGRTLSLAQEACQAFLDCTPTQLTEMQQMLQAKDWEALGCLVHSLKSTCAMVGGQRMTQAAIDLEDHLRSQHYAHLAPLLHIVEQEFLPLQAQIQTWLAQHP